MQVAELAHDNVGATHEALQGTAQCWQHDFSGIAHACFDAVENLHQHRYVCTDNQIRGETAWILFGVCFPGFGLVLDLLDAGLDQVAVFFDTVCRHANGYIWLEALLHELEKLVAGLLYQLLGFDFTYQLTLAFFQFGNDVGEVGNDTFRVLVGIKQVIDLTTIDKGRESIERVAGVAMAGAYATAIYFS